MAGGDLITETIGNFANLFSSWSNVTILLLFTAVIIIYSVFVYYFYRFLAKKNLIGLNLSQYNKSEHAVATKFFAFLLYIIEYIIILPVVTFFWFAVFAVLLLVLAKGLSVGTIIVIAAALIASVRVTAYVSENLSRDLAKMVPFTLLALSLTQPDFFSVGLLLERASQIPGLLTSIPYYLLFIVGVELIMRIFDLLRKLFVFEKQVEVEQKVLK